jgi:phosphoribosylformylglycinamidine synthase
MAFAGGLGARVDIALMPHDLDDLAGHERYAALLFSESNSRFLCEVPPDEAAQFELRLADAPFALLGEVTAEPTLEIVYDDEPLLNADIAALKEAWQKPLRW